MWYRNAVIGQCDTSGFCVLKTWMNAASFPHGNCIIECLMCNISKLVSLLQYVNLGIYMKS